MELLEFEGYKCLLQPGESAYLGDLILEELSKFDSKALLAEPSETSTIAGNNYYIVQKYSDRWGEYIDLLDLKDVKDGDKLTVIPKPIRECGSTPYVGLP